MSVDQTLSLTVSAQDQGASVVFGDVLARIQAIEVELNKLAPTAQAAGAGVAAGAQTAAAGTEKVAVATTEVNAALKQMEGHMGTVARGMTAMGSAAGAAAARVEGLGGAFIEMQEAAPQLLLIAGAMGTVIAAFGVLKSSISIATQMQSEFETLGAAVEAQGQSWKDAESGVQAYLNTEAMATGFTRTELVPALNDLVTAHVDVHDAEIIESVATEEAIAKHRSLQEVVDALLEAEAGRGMVLAELDTRLKPLIQDHAKLDQILQVMHADNLDQVSDGDALERMQERQKVAYEEVGETIGNKLIPMMTWWSETMIGAMHNAAQFGEGMHELWSSVVDEIQAALMALTGFEAALADLATGKAAHIGTDFKTAFSEAGKDLQQAFHDLQEGWKNATWGIPTAADVGHRIVNEAEYLHDQQLRNINLNNNPQVGLTRPGGGASSYEPSYLSEPTEDTTALTAGLSAVATASKNVTAAQAAMKQAIDPTADSIKNDAQAAQQLHTAYTQAEDNIRALVPVVESEESAMKSSRDAVEEKYQALQHATAAYQQIENSLSGHTKLTRDDKVAVDDAKRSYDEAKASYDKANEALKSQTATLDKQSAALAKDKTAVDAFVKSQRDMIAAYNDAIEKDNQQVADERETDGKSLQQQIAYYAQRYAIAHTANEQFYQDHGYFDKQLLGDDQQLYGKLTSLQEQAYKQQINDLTNFVQQWEDKEKDWFDNLLEGTTSLRDTLKDVWKQIVDDYVQMLEQMVAKSAIFKQLNTTVEQLFGSLAQGKNGAGIGTAINALGGGTTPDVNSSNGVLGVYGDQVVDEAVNGASMGALQYGLTGVIVGSSGAQQIVASMPSATSSGGNGGGSGAIDASVGLGVVGAAQAGAGGTGGVTTGGGGINLGAGSGGNKTIGDILGGAAIGSAVTTATGENPTYGALGGAAGGLFTSLLTGGAQAAFAADPLLGAAVDVAGSLVGGLFGNSSNNETDEPDVYEPSYGTGTNYGQFVTDINGATGMFNGTQYTPTPQFQQTSEASQLATEIQQLPQGADSTLVQLADQLKSLNENLTSTGFGVASEKQGEFTLQSGAQISVEDYMQLVSQFQSAYTGSGLAPSAPLFQLTRTYPNFNLPTVTDANGNVVIAPSSSTSSSSASSSSSPVSSLPGLKAGAQGVYVDMSGATIVGPSGLDTVATAIAQALQRLNAGQIAGGYTTSISSRLATKSS